VNRHIVLLVLLVCFAGCSDIAPNPADVVRQAPPPAEVTVSTTTHCLVPDTIEANAQPNMTESGVVVFIRVTSLDGTVGGTMRYPEGGVVWANLSPQKHALRPSLCIPKQDNVTIEVMVVAIPNTISIQGLNIIGYAFTEIAETVLPGGRLIRAIEGFLLDQATDATKDALKEGRLIGKISLSA
jgi:hypothetical protein